MMRTKTVHILMVFFLVRRRSESSENPCGPKTIKKLQDERAVIDDEFTTVEDIQILLGLTLFAARILRIPMAQFYYIIKLVRRRMSCPQTKAPFTLAHVWPSVKQQWHRLIDSLLRNPWTRHVGDEDHQMVLVCDASTTGWGGILFEEATGCVRQSHGAWSETHVCAEINEMEMRGLQNSLEAFCDFIGDKPLLILMDNTASVHALHKGAAHAFRLNQEALAVLKRLPRNASVKIAYIEGTENPADDPSRGKSLFNFRRSLGTWGGGWRGTLYE